MSVVKVSVIAEELGVTAKTVYNWIADGDLETIVPGYVDSIEAYEAWLRKRQFKSIYASEMARKGITRDANGRFLTKAEREKSAEG